MIDKGQQNRSESLSTIGSGVLNLNLSALVSVSSVSASVMASYGLTEDVIERIFEGQYRCVRSVNGGVIEIYSLSAFTNGTMTSIYLQCGDGDYAWSQFALTRNTKGGTWTVHFNEI